MRAGVDWQDLSVAWRGGTVSLRLMDEINRLLDDHPVAVRFRLLTEVEQAMSANGGELRTMDDLPAWLQDVLRNPDVSDARR